MMWAIGGVFAMFTGLSYVLTRPTEDEREYRQRLVEELLANTERPPVIIHTNNNDVIEGEEVDETVNYIGLFSHDIDRAVEGIPPALEIRSGESNDSSDDNSSGRLKCNCDFPCTSTNCGTKGRKRALSHREGRVLRRQQRLAETAARNIHKEENSKSIEPEKLFNSSYIGSKSTVDQGSNHSLSKTSCCDVDELSPVSDNILDSVLHDDCSHEQFDPPGKKRRFEFDQTVDMNGNESTAVDLDSSTMDGSINVSNETSLKVSKNEIEVSGVDKVSSVAAPPLFATTLPSAQSIGIEVLAVVGNGPTMEENDL